MVVSGVYDCQFVLVPKLVAVLKLRSGPTLASPCGFHGNHCCNRNIAYVSRMPTTLKPSSAPAY